MSQHDRDEAIYMAVGFSMLIAYLGAVVAVLTWPITGG